MSEEAIRDHEILVEKLEKKLLLLQKQKKQMLQVQKKAISDIDLKMANIKGTVNSSKEILKKWKNNATNQ